MTQEAPEIAAPATATAGSLARTTARGFVWMAAQSVVSKGVGMVGQWALAWLLAPGDFSLIALAYTVTTFAGLLQQAGLREVLVHRHRRLGLWATPAFWMSLAMGFLGAGLMLAGAPVAAAAFDEPRVAELIAVIAISAPLSSLTTLPLAALQGDMRFRALASFNLMSNTLMIALQVLLAWMGFGAFAFALARPITAVVEIAVAWWMVAPRIRWRPRLRVWKHLFADSGVMLAVAFIYTGVTQLGPIVLGGLRLGDVVGLYFWAYNLSLQTLMLFSTNLKQVLFASLRQLEGEPERQKAAFLRATRLLGMVVTPLCLLQAAAAEPVVRLIFEDEWLPAVPMLQVLSIGMALLAVVTPANGLLMAQGRFRMYLLLSVISAAMSLTFTPLGGLLGGGIGVAIATTLHLAISAPVNLRLTLKPLGGTWREIAGALLPACGLGIATAGAGYLAQLGVRTMTDNATALLAATGAAALAAYVLTARTLMPASWREVMTLVQSVLRRGRQ
jgi:PST family polysaccharide transporter